MGQDVWKLNGVVANVEVLELLPDPAFFTTYNNFDADCLERIWYWDKKALFDEVFLLKYNFFALILEIVGSDFDF